MSYNSKFKIFNKKIQKEKISEMNVLCNYHNSGAGFDVINRSNLCLHLNLYSEKGSSGENLAKWNKEIMHTWMSTNGWGTTRVMEL